VILSFAIKNGNTLSVTFRWKAKPYSEGKEFIPDSLIFYFEFIK